MRAFCYRVAAILAVLVGVATLDALFTGALPPVGGILLLAGCALVAWRTLRRELRRGRKRRARQAASHRQRALPGPPALRLAAKTPPSQGPNAA